MITAITISNTATYQGVPVTIGPLKPVNYLFGGNGSGKTTISRILASGAPPWGCSIDWQHGNALRTWVYNCDFVRASFFENGDVPGIFTLGEDNVERQKAIETARGELAKIEARIAQLTETLSGADGKGGKKAELAACFANFAERCWQEKKRHEARFKPAFKGFQGNMKRFATQVITVQKQRPTDAPPPPSFAQLTDLATELFGTVPPKEPLIAPLHGDAIIGLHAHVMFNKAIVGKADVDLAGLIKKLDNGDWVHRGRTYLADAEQRCPFCQQPVPATLSQQLAEFFDETYVANLRDLKTASQRYTAAAQSLLDAGRAILNGAHARLAKQDFEIGYAALKTRLDSNLGLLESKQREPSRRITLEDVSEQVAALNRLVELANGEIRKQHQRVTNFDAERRQLVAHVWAAIVAEMDGEIRSYRTEATRINAGIKSMEAKVVDARREREQTVRKLQSLEREITSTKPTVDRINKLLISYGFESFQLVSTANDKSYRIVRSDGTSDATRLLSEGERTFISFLYFYHLVMDGHQAEADIAAPRVVIIDDPVSSLDSDILFIVSALIKEVRAAVFDADAPIRQLFVLTHNVYFHRELTHRVKGEREPGYWTLRKVDNRTSVRRHDDNPVKTTYQMLWDELKQADAAAVQGVAVRNAMRRILEYYFKQLGGTPLDRIEQHFEGGEKLVCASLISWAHAGSHAAFDDPSLAPSADEASRQLKVFNRIFVETGHTAHYKMMMGEAA